MNPFQKLGAALAGAAGAAIILWSADVHGWLDPTTAAWAQAVGTVAAIAVAAWAALRQIGEGLQRERRDREASDRSRRQDLADDRQVAVALLQAVVDAVETRRDMWTGDRSFDEPLLIVEGDIAALNAFPVHLLRDIGVARWFLAGKTAAAYALLAAQAGQKEAKRGAISNEQLQLVADWLASTREAAEEVAARCATLIGS